MQCHTVVLVLDQMLCRTVVLVWDQYTLQNLEDFQGECLIQLVFLVALLEDDSDAKLVRAMCIQVYFYVHNKYIL